MLFKHENEKQLKQEIVNRLGNKVDSLKKLAEEIDEFTPLGGVATSDSILQPGFLMAKDLLVLDGLTKRLISLLNDKEVLLDDAKNRKAHMKTGNLKKYIHERLPENDFKSLFHTLSTKYQMLNKTLEKWHEANAVNGIISANNLSDACIQFNLITKPVDKSFSKQSLAQKIPENISKHRDPFLARLKEYTNATKILAEKKPERVQEIYKKTQEAMEELKFKQNPLQLDI